MIEKKILVLQGRVYLSLFLDTQDPPCWLFLQLGCDILNQIESSLPFLYDYRSNKTALKAMSS